MLKVHCGGEFKEPPVVGDVTDILVRAITGRADACFAPYMGTVLVKVLTDSTTSAERRYAWARWVLQWAHCGSAQDPPL